MRVAIECFGEEDPRLFLRILLRIVAGFGSGGKHTPLEVRDLTSFSGTLLVESHHGP